MMTIKQICIAAEIRAGVRIEGHEGTFHIEGAQDGKVSFSGGKRGKGRWWLPIDYVRAHATVLTRLPRTYAQAGVEIGAAE